MTHSRTVIAAALAVLTTGALTSCSEGDGRTSSSPTSPPPSVTSLEPSSSATPATEAASQAAGDKLRDYYAVRNRLRQNLRLPLTALKQVATSGELSAQKNLFTSERRQGLHQVGTTKIARLEIQSVNLDNSDPKAGKVPTVQIDVCFNVTGVDVVDANGSSVVRADRPDTGWIQYLVANYRWSTNPNGGWRVASSKDLRRTPCDAS